jgi:putative FmdB family regulatory protein
MAMIHVFGPSPRFMPTYEYACLKCQAQFEVSQRISDAPLTQCPKELCPAKKWGKGKVQRGVGGGAGLLFKGSGFYITDYRSTNYKSGAAGESKTAGSSGATASTASTPKPTPSPTKPSAKSSAP